MKDGWHTKRFEDVLDIRNGKNQRDVESNNGIYPIYGSAGKPMGLATDYICEAGTTIIGRKGTIDNPIYVETRFWNVDTAFGLSAKPGLDPRFLNFFCQSYDFKSHNRGTTIPSLVKSDLLQISIPIPPLSEQQRIVGILNQAFAVLSTAKVNAEKNLQNARALFEASLEAAVKGHLTREWRRGDTRIEDAGIDLARRLDDRRSLSKKRAKYEEPAKPVTSRPIDIPASWVLASPEEITSHIVDCPHTTPKWAESGALCLRTTNFRPGYLDLGTVQFVSEETYQERILRLEPRSGDVVYSREGGILGIACVIPPGMRTCMGQRMMLFRLDYELALPTYFAAVLNSKLILTIVKRLTGGATAPHLNIRDIRTFPIPLPPMAEQRQIVAKLEALSAETQRLEAIYREKITAIADLKKSLLHQAFTGQLTAA